MTDRRAKSPKVGKLKRRLTLFLAVVLALAVSFVVLTKSPLVSYHVQKYINQHVLEDSRFEFSCRAITGDLVNTVVLHDPVVRYHGTDASFNVFRADRIEVDYSLKGVLRMNLIVEDLHLKNVRLQIRRDRDGQVILPVPIDDELTRSSGVFAPRVEVQKFLIDGLQLSFGGGERELAIRDVNLEGSYLLERGVGRVRIDRGNAFIVGPETAVPTIEMDVYHEQASLRVTGFSVRLGQSFIMANGEFEDGKFKDLQFIFNPVVLDELHALGLMPDIEGELGGNVKLNGGLDRLSFQGDVTGVAFGMVMNSLHFDALILNQEVVFDTLWGEVYGAKLAGDFRYGWGGKKGFTYDGKVGGMDLRQGFIPDAGLPEMDLYATGTLHYDGDKTYTISAGLDSARIDDYRAGHGSFEGEWNSDYGLRIDAFLFERPGYKIEGSGRVDAQGYTDIVFGASGMDFSYFWDYASLPQFSVGVSVNGKVAGPIENLRINLNGDVENAEYLFAGIDSASVQAEVRGVGGEDVSAIVDLNGRSIFVAGKKFESPHLLLEVDGGTTFIRDFSFSKRDSFLTTDFEVSSHGDTVRVLFKHVAFEMPGQQWRNDSPATLVVGPGALSLDSLVLVSGKSAVGFRGDYSWRDGSLNMVGRGIDFELGFVREALGLRMRLEGKSDFRVEVAGDTDNPVVDVDVGIGPGAVDRVRFDALSLRAAFEGDRWRLDELLVVSDGDSLSGTGWWATDISPIAALTGRADIRRGFERPFYFDVDSRAFSIPAIMNAIHAPSYVDGAFTGKASFRNTLTNPYLTIEGTIDPIPRGTAMGPFPNQASAVTTAGLRLPPTTVRIAHRYGEVEISEVSVGDGFNAKLTGVLPVGLNLIEGFQP
ncbi:MAG: hypothetical protein KAT30_12155, partial [Candidatus Krumholzibacteria bacterium]|nr:hypothetical protein [Candidatus Krumholzibacteria bacterium]